MSKDDVYQVTASRKRPSSFSSLLGQDFVVSTLESALRNNKIAHAYLFSGPRGVGKTSTARLLAKALNCEKGISADPCGVCHSCQEIAGGISVDVIEIDGASNTSVNDIRAIKEEVLYHPEFSRFKIYIIDEVHMLSISAFNALLKTIEEPPSYVIFIFATTEEQKVPLTIRSRCQQFKFRLLSQEEIALALKTVAEETKTKADEDALFWIAKESGGSLRDAYTLFDQIEAFSDSHISLDGIYKKLSLAPISSISAIVEDMVFGKEKEGIEKLSSLFLEGISAEEIIKETASFFRSLLLYKEGVKRMDILSVPVKDIPVSLVSLLTSEQLSYALSSLLSLYRELRFSLSSRFDTELFFYRLPYLKYYTSKENLVMKLENLKKEILEENNISVITEKEEEEEEEPYSGEEEITLSALPKVKEALDKMDRVSLSNSVMAVEKIEENKEGEHVLFISKMSAYKTLMKDIPSLTKAFSSATGRNVFLNIQYVKKESGEKENTSLSPEMRKLKSVFGGRIIKVEEKEEKVQPIEEDETFDEDM